MKIAIEKARNIITVPSSENLTFFNDCSLWKEIANAKRVKEKVNIKPSKMHIGSTFKMPIIRALVKK